MGRGRDAGPAEGRRDAWEARLAETVGIAPGEEGVGDGMPGWLNDCGWQSWSRPEDGRSTPQVGQ
jgi:hypothetical protein